MGIVDRKKQELKNNAKKKIIKVIKPYLINAIIFMLIAVVFFVAITSIADKMKDLLNVAATFVSNIWKWITDDYWIDLTKEIDVEYTDSSGNTVTESRTLMDHYMYQLDELGISLKDLRLLGDADYSDPNLLEDPENKAKVQKYLKAFVVADLITSQIHRRNSSELVYKPSNAITGIAGKQEYDDIVSDKIDGGIYLYRTKDVTSVSDISEDQNTNNTQTPPSTNNSNTTGKTINTSSYGLTSENVQIEMDNIKNEYKIAWISDLHMMQPDESTINNDWYASHSTTFEQRNNGFNNSYAILPKIIECLNGNDFDAIVFGGDIMDNYSSDNFNYLKEQINKLTNKNIMFLVADHDYLTEMTTNDSVNKAAASLGVGGEIKNITIGKDGDSISLIGQNYANERISDDAINTIGNYLNSSINSLFFTHVPVESKTQASAMQQWSRSVHNDQVYYWSSAASSSGYTNPPSNYLNTLYNSNSLKGVFAGHVHASGDFELNTGIKEHIFNASFRNSIGVITITPTGTVSGNNTGDTQGETQTTPTQQEGTQTGDNLADCYRMEYLELEKFRERVDTFNTSVTGTGRGDIEKYFTIDEDGNLLIAQVDGYIETEKIQKGFFDTSQYEGESSYTATIKKIDYKKEVAQYTLPYEFLIDLCMVTENPEFVYHVAEMSLNTNISLLIQNNETTVVDEEVQNGTWVKEKRSKSGNISEQGTENYTRTKTRITTTTNPILKVKGINTWSTYKKIEWRDRVLQNENTNQLPGTYSDPPGGWTHVPAYKPNAIDDPSGTKQGHDEYWEREYFRDYTITKTHTTVTNNYYSIEGNVIRKSDNFLGLLRNKTGQYIEGTTPDFKVDGSKFDRNGINVSYKIPGRSIEEDPLSRLKSGEQMLYSILKQNERTEPLVELIQYYLTFPEQEYYDLTGQEIEDILGGFNDANQKIEYDEIKDANELEILYKICEAEAGGSSEEEIGHVASVILNRVKCSSWGNTIKEVVFQKSQFAPVSNGSYEKANPSQKTKNAVDKVLSNGDTTGGAVYFRTEESAKKAGMPTSSSESHATYIYLFTDPNTHVFLTNKKSLEELKGSATSATKPATGKLKDVFPDGIPTTREGMQKYLTTISVPITTKNGDKKTKNITIHKAIAEDVKEVLKKAQDGGFKVYDVQCFSWRDVKGSNKLSQHAYGLAVDINVNENCQIKGGKVTAGSFWRPGENEYSIPRDGVLVKAFKAIGWGWGGEWTSSKDYMHFSYTGQ